MIAFARQASFRKRTHGRQYGSVSLGGVEQSLYVIETAPMAGKLISTAVNGRQST